MIHTESVAAEMIDNLPRSENPTSQPVGDAVGLVHTHAPSSEIEYAVIAPLGKTLGPQPRPTLVGASAVYLGPEPLLECPGFDYRSFRWPTAQLPEPVPIAQAPAPSGFATPVHRTRDGRVSGQEEMKAVTSAATAAETERR